MPRIHPYLKGLAETRALADGEYLRLTALVDEVTQRQLAALATRTACDRLICKFDGRLEPARIHPVNGWQGRYGERGALGRAILEITKLAYPSELSTPEISVLLQLKFDLVFDTPAERHHWFANSVRSRLKYLARTGVIERMHDPLVNTQQSGRWRWLPPGGPFCDLATLAAQAGVTTTYALDLDDDMAPATIAETADLDEDNLPR